MDPKGVTDLLMHPWAVDRSWSEQGNEQVRAVDARRDCIGIGLTSLDERITKYHDVELLQMSDDSVGKLPVTPRVAEKHSTELGS